MAYEPQSGRQLSKRYKEDAATDDVELIAAAIAGPDAEAYGELVRRHQSQVRLFLLRLCRDRSEADDLAQDCFVHAWRKLSSYRGSGSFAGWLLKIAWTTFLQAKRRSDRYREVIEQAMHAGVTPHHAGITEELGDLDRLLAALNEQERAVLILSYGCGLSHREIGETATLPLGTVKSIIFRAKEKLRKNFDIEDHQYG